MKRYGKTWINRGPGILPDWIWPNLWLDPMGEIKTTAQRWKPSPAAHIVILVCCKRSLQRYSHLLIMLSCCFFGDLCSIWGNQLVSNEWRKLNGATEARDLNQGQLSDGHDLSVMLPERPSLPLTLHLTGQKVKVKSKFWRSFQAVFSHKLSHYRQQLCCILKIAFSSDAWLHFHCC